MFLAEDNEKDLQDSMDTNYSGFVHCIKAAYRLMKKHNADGHIININSILGNSPQIGARLETVPLFNSYVPAKCAVVGMAEMIRQELNYLNNRKVKISVRKYRWFSAKVSSWYFFLITDCESKLRKVKPDGFGTLSG